MMSVPTLKKQVKTCEYLQKLEVNKAKLYDTIVTIEFEGSDERLSAHKGLICHYSGFFHTAFNGRFSESSSGTVKLPKGDRFAFNAFFRWLYQGQMFENEKALVSHMGGLHDDLYKVYVFADFRIIPALKNAVIDLCISNFSETLVMPSPVSVTKIWQKCPENDAMTKLFVDYVTKSNSSNWTAFSPKSQAFFPESTRGQYPEGFLFQVCKQLVDAEQLREPKHMRNYWAKVDKCLYHDHSEVAPKSGVVIDVEAESKTAAKASNLKLTMPKRKVKAEGGAPAKRRSTFGRVITDTDAYQQAS